MNRDNSSSDSSLNQSISFISHKLRTPLTVIMSTVNNFLDGAYGPLGDEQKKWIQKLSVHTLNLETLLNDVFEILKNPIASAAVEMSWEAQEKKIGVTNPAKTNSDKNTAITSSARSRVILIVDDEPDILDVIKEALSMKGFQTHTASDGPEAIAKAIELKPDLILMDVLLKHQNGMDVCASIKSKLSSFTPVILVTGQDDLRQKIAGAKHAADDLLTKPFQMEELYARVTSMLRLKQLSDAVERLSPHGKER